MLIIGSQAIHGAFDESELPDLTMLSREVDVAFFDDEDESRADSLDGAIGELSHFDETYGYYAQGVSVDTATLPEGWEERLIDFSNAEAPNAKAKFLDPHDLVLSKLAAQRQKDRDFARVLVENRLIDPTVLLERLETLPVASIVKSNIRRFITGLAG